MNVSGMCPSFCGCGSAAAATPRAREADGAIGAPILFAQKPSSSPSRAPPPPLDVLDVLAALGGVVPPAPPLAGMLMLLAKKGEAAMSTVGTVTVSARAGSELK
eukprot:1196014-Prorocentrum_minimum.AAC.4